NAVVVRDGERRTGCKVDSVFGGWRQIALDHKEADAIERAARDRGAIGDDFDGGLSFFELSGVGESADAENLRPRYLRAEDRGRMRPNPAIVVAEFTLNLIPALTEAGGVARQREVDGIVTVAGVEFRAQFGGKQIVDAALILRAVPAATREGAP